MEKQALEFIQSTAGLAEVVEQLAKASLDMPVIAKAQGIELRSIEKYLSQRQRMDFCFKTRSIDDFVVYVNEHQTADSICVFDDTDARQLVAKTVFDHGTPAKPLHQEHSSILELKRMSAYTALMNANGSYGQRELSDWFEEYADFIQVFTKDGVSMAPAAAASAVRSLTIERAKEVKSVIEDFSENMSAMESVAAKNSDQLPAVIIFKCIPFLSFSEYKFELRISIITSGDKPSFAVRHLGLELVQDQIAQEFAAIITDGFKEGDIKCYRGLV